MTRHKKIAGWAVLIVVLGAPFGLMIYGLVLTAQQHGVLFALAIFPGIPLAGFALYLLLRWAAFAITDADR